MHLQKVPRVLGNKWAVRVSCSLNEERKIGHLSATAKSFEERVPSSVCEDRGRVQVRSAPPHGSDIGGSMSNDFFVANRLDEDPAVFHARFWRCHRLLHFIACRVLGGPEHADAAIENCWLTASRNPPRFEYESAFRSWLLRVLIDEALALLRERGTVKPGNSRRPAREEVFPEDDIIDGESNPTTHHDQVSRGVPVAVE